MPPTARSCHQALRSHLLEPGAGDVPVVAHVVVVPEHRDRDGREAASGSAGRSRTLVVEPGVLLEVGDLLAGRGARCRGARGSARGSAASPRRRRPGRRAGRAAPATCSRSPRIICVGQDVQGVELVAVFVVVLGLRVGLLVGHGDPAGAEADVERLAAAEGADRARRQVASRARASAARRRARPRTRRSRRARGPRSGPARSGGPRPRRSARGGRGPRPRRARSVSTQIVASVSET